MRLSMHLPEERRSKEAIFDTAYGTGKIREEMATRQTNVISPVPEGIGKDGCFPKAGKTRKMHLKQLDICYFEHILTCYCN